VNAGAIKIDATFRESRANIPPGKATATILIDGIKPVDICTSHKMQIAIVGIKFKNNEEWHYDILGETRSSK